MSRSKPPTPLAAATALAVPLAIGLTTPTAAQSESFWNSTNDGDFHDPANWLGPVPDETVTAIFGINAEYNVHFAEADATSDQLIVRDGHVDLRLYETNDFGTTFPRVYDALNPLFTTPAVIVGDDALGEPHLTIWGGTVNSQFTIIGFAPGSTGTLDFELTSGLWPTLVNEAHVHVGHQGTGVLNIVERATVSCTDAVIGTTSTGTGEVTVSWWDSVLDCWGTLTVGKQGQGTLAVYDSGDVVCNGVIIGQQPGSSGEASVSGPGSILTINGPLDVGLEGEGALLIADGGAVICDGYVSIGTLPPFPGEEGGGVGELTVTGPASVLITYDVVYAGFQSAGTLNILDGATVICGFGFISTESNQVPLGQAVVQGPGSIWAADGGLVILGSLNVSDGGTVLGTVQIFEEGLVEGDGTLIGTVVNTGIMTPGNPVGTLTIDGSLVQGFGPLPIELAGTDAGAFDAIDVIGTALVGGELAVTLVDGFVPQVGDRFPILTADFLDASFDPVNLPDLGAVKKWVVLKDFTSVELLATSIADLDEDGSVGVADFLKLLARWGPCPDPPDPCPADLDGDGTVGEVDFLILLAFWG